MVRVIDDHTPEAELALDARASTLFALAQQHFPDLRLDCHPRLFHSITASRHSPFPPSDRVFFVHPSHAEIILYSPQFFDRVVELAHTYEDSVSQEFTVVKKY